MRVFKCGDGLAIHLPASVVQALGLEEGDELEMHVVSESEPDAADELRRKRPLERIRALRKELAPGFDPKATLAQRAQFLRGKSIGVGAIQANPPAYLKVVAARSGIDPESIKVTAMEGNAQLAAFASKSIDGMSNSPPFPLKPVLDGLSVIIASGPDGDPPNAINFAYNVVLTRPETCEKKKSLCQKIGRVYRDATAYIHDHPKETVAILQKNFPNLEAALIESAFEQIKKSTPRVPSVTRESLENADDFNVEAGFMKADQKLKSYDGLFTNG